MTKNCTRCGNEATDDALFCPHCGNSLKAAGGDPMLGTVVADRYLLSEKIGEGRSGIIYRGEHVALRKKVAVKILHHSLSEDETAIERFRREATTVCEIDNDHILQVLDFGRCTDGRLFFAMELLDGEPLSKVLERDKKLDVQRAIDILVQVGEALMEAHGLGYIHRDLRPRNIFLTKKRGKSDFVKLLDFGLAKLVVADDAHAGQTVMGITFGDPRYISPEQAKGDPVDRRTDIYSLGVIAWEMLVGEPPFTGDRAADVIQHHLQTPPPPLRARRSDVPAWLEQVVQRAMAKAPGERFVTVLRMVECLKEKRAPGAADTEGKVTPPAVAAARTEATKAAGTNGEAKAAKTATPPKGVAADKSGKAAGKKGGKDKRDDKRKTGERPAIQSKAADTKAKLDSWWPPAGKQADGPAGSTLALPTVVDAATAQTKAMPTIADKAPEPPVSVKAVADASSAVALPVAAPPPPVEKRPSTPPPLELDVTAPSPKLDIEEPPPPPPERVGTKSSKHRAMNQTGEHERLFFDDNAPAVHADEDEFDAPPRRNTAMIAGLSVGGALVVGLVALALLGHHGGSEEQAPKRDYNKPAVSAALEGKTPPAAPAAHVDDHPAAPAKAEKPVVAAAPAAVVQAPVAPPAPPPVAVKAPPPVAPPAPPPAVEKKAEVVAKVEKPPVEKHAQEKVEKPAEKAKPAKHAAVPEGFRDPFADKGAPSSASQADTFVKLGRQKLNSGDSAGAKALFSKAREVDASNADAIAGLGECAFEQGDYVNAASELKLAARLAPRKTRNVVLLGQAYYKLGKYKEAVAEYKRALKLDPRNQEAAQSLEVAERKLGGG